MRAKFSSRLKNPMVLLMLLTALLFVSSCRNNEVEVPPLIGDSGHHLFLTIQANPDHLVIHEPGRPRETSDISIQLKNQQGQGVPGENLKLRILNATGNEINIGRLSDLNAKTDAAGFVHVVYTAPDTSEIAGATSVIIEAILTNASYPREVTDHHEIELQNAAVDPGDCSSGGLVPQGEITVSPANPVVNETVCFTGTTAFPTAIEFFWDFNGDGRSDATGATACTTFSQAGSFQVFLLARSLDRDCGTASTVVTVEPGEPATCTIVASPSSPLIGEDVNFTAITDDPDGRVRRFSWNFGDGTPARTSSRNTITHDFDRAGSFTVILTITDDQGNVSTCQTTVTVGAGAPGDPICAFTVSPTDIIVGTTVQINASASTDPDGDIVNYNVDFGEPGEPAVDSPDPIVVKPSPYDVAGTFTITLTVRDDDGNETSCSQTVTVSEPGPALTQCNDGADNDNDGFADFGGANGDPGCFNEADTSELNTSIQCDDGTDNDLDGGIDTGGGPAGGPDDQQCIEPTDNDEAT
jgi:PKD domain